MSNRIDLTLYEGHTKGDPNDNPDSWRVVGDGFVMNGTSPQLRYIGYIRHSNFEPDIPATQEPLSRADANLIADGPLLLAELKRSYEELDEAKAYEETAEHLSNMIDSMWEKLDNWDMCFDDYSMHDLHNNLDEKYARDNEGNIILKELYSYTEEDGWQRKEPASE